MTTTRGKNTCGCGQPAKDAAICPSCVDLLGQALADVPIYAADLEVTLTRQARHGDRNSGGRSAETPLPFHPAASEAGWVLTNTLTSWMRALDAQPAGMGGSLRGMAFWLRHHLGQLAQHPDAYDAVDEIASAVYQVRRIIDRPAERVYAGPCDGHTYRSDGTGATLCGADLYALPGHRTGTCRACGTPYSVPERRTRLAAQLEDREVTATEAARYLTALGTPTAASTVRSWAHRGTLTAIGHTVRGATYRFGDVLDLATRRVTLDTVTCCNA